MYFRRWIQIMLPAGIFSSKRSHLQVVFHCMSTTFPPLKVKPKTQRFQVESATLYQCQRQPGKVIKDYWEWRKDQRTVMHIVGSSFLAHVITTTRLSASVAGEAISFKRAKRKHASNLHIYKDMFLMIIPLLH